MNIHLTDHQLLAYLEGELPPERCERVRSHLRTCPACRARLERLTRTAEELTATLHAVGERVPLAPARSWNALVQRRKRPRPRLLALKPHPFLYPVVTLLVLVLVAAGFLGLIHTLAVTDPTPTREPPTPSSSPATNPSLSPGPLPHSTSGRLTTPISLLILGTDGESATSDQMDTLLLLYVDAGAERALLISIPSHLYVDVPDRGQVRAGSVYGLGKRGENTTGLALAREAISTTLGLPVHHVALVRFESFVTLVDAIGGVVVEVPYPIEDPRFPDDRGGYDPLQIPAGPQHFDGATALRYARTRVVPAPGFDRRFRQRQLVLAAHDRVTRLDLLPDLIAQARPLWSAVADGLETDLTLSRVIELALLSTDLTVDDVTAIDLATCCATPATAPSGESVLLPCPDEIQTVIESWGEEE